jgi:hypothetical protein
MRLLALAAAALWASPAAGPAPEKEKGSVVSQNITIKGKAAHGPPVTVPPPMLDKAALDEVARSLEFLNSKHQPSLADIPASSAAKNLLKTFPEPPYLLFQPRWFPYPADAWRFEVLADGKVVFRVQGRGKPAEAIGFDGVDSVGRVLVRAGQKLRWRFTGFDAGSELALQSVEIEALSLSYKDTWGALHLEAPNSKIFVAGEPRLSDEGAEFLAEMASRMDRLIGRSKVHPVVLFQAEPDSRLAQGRAKALAAYFSKHLLLSPELISVDLRPVDDRGDVTACEFPPDKGAVIRSE